MTLPKTNRYFVLQLDADSYRPMREAAFEVQILDDEGRADRSAYIGRDSDVVIALVESGPDGPELLPPEHHGIPLPVIEAARKRQAGFGEYVNDRGDVVRPLFLGPQ